MLMLPKEMLSYAAFSRWLWFAVQSGVQIPSGGRRKFRTQDCQSAAVGQPVLTVIRDVYFMSKGN